MSDDFLRTTWGRPRVFGNYPRSPSQQVSQIRWHCEHWSLARMSISRPPHTGHTGPWDAVRLQLDSAVGRRRSMFSEVLIGSYFSASQPRRKAGRGLSLTAGENREGEPGNVPLIACEIGSDITSCWAPQGPLSSAGQIEIGASRRMGISGARRVEFFTDLFAQGFLS